MNKNLESTQPQRRFIESLAQGKTLDELALILAPAFRSTGKSWEGLRDTTLNHKLARLDKIGASMCIAILKDEKEFAQLKTQMCAKLAAE